MGAFYANITLKGPDQASVASALRGRNAVVVPKIGDCIVAFDSVCDAQDSDAIKELTSRISRELHCAAFAAIVHDDDVFAYFLYENGDLTDWYNSAPSYFDFGSTKEPLGPAGGNAERLCAVFQATNPAQVESILRKPRFALETERHKELARALGLPPIAIGHVVASFDGLEYPDGLLADQIIWTADHELR
jgi:hypothetical protein